MRRFALFAALLLPLAVEAQVAETITVERVLIDVRATDHAGDPILGLTAADFTVLIDGKRAAIESVTWVPETAAARALAGVDDEETPSAVPSASGEPVPQGRLFVIFIQTDFGRAWQRLKGQMHFLPYTEKMLEMLEPEDRVAVFSFDSHLKFRLDFTSDREAVARAVRDALAIDEPPSPPVVPNPSLARRLDREAMLKMTGSDQALLHIANALRPIPGPKSLLLLGWGLGERVNGRVVMSPTYLIARRVLEQARTTIFVLDTTYADYHDLEVGLRKSAADTGGTYAKTAEFPQIAVERLQRTLAGHYELEVRKPEGLRPGTHAIEVRTSRRGAEITARNSYIDSP